MKIQKVYINHKNKFKIQIKIFKNDSNTIN